ncbi:MAG: hypothetical protein ABMB14_32720, partial [Myxococcota bacterium]
MDVDEIYAAVVDGTGTGGDLGWTRKPLRDRAFDRAKTGDPAQRAGALTVSALLGRDHQPVAAELVTDPDPQVRNRAFDLVLDAGAAGLPAIRDAAAGSDPELAGRALDLLIVAVDAASTTLGWRSLSSPHPGIRARGAAILGLTAGPSVGPD